MDVLKKRILKDGIIVGSDIIRVDSFLNHQVDSFLLFEMAKEWKKRFEGVAITKILTVEASGIALAAMVSLELGVPFVFAKKYNARNIDSAVYEAEVYSFTKQQGFILRVSKEYIKENDTVLIIDDFLANGRAALGLMDIIKQAGAQVAGIGIAIEKGFQDGGELIRSMDVRLESLAVIESIKQGKICFK